MTQDISLIHCQLASEICFGPLCVRIFVLSMRNTNHLCAWSRLMSLSSIYKDKGEMKHGVVMCKEMKRLYVLEGASVLKETGELLVWSDWYGTDLAQSVWLGKHLNQNQKLYFQNCTVAACFGVLLWQAFIHYHC